MFSNDTISALSRNESWSIFIYTQFISNISQINSRVLEFDQGLWISLIEVATVPPDGEKKINLRLRNGEERIIDLAK